VEFIRRRQSGGAPPDEQPPARTKKVDAGEVSSHAKNNPMALDLASAENLSLLEAKYHSAAM
jgi:hypothetical protein